MTRIGQIFGFGPSREDRELMEDIQARLHVLNYTLPKGGVFSTTPATIVRIDLDNTLHFNVFALSGRSERFVGYINAQNGKITYAPAV